MGAKNIFCTFVRGIEIKYSNAPATGCNIVAFTLSKFPGGLKMNPIREKSNESSLVKNAGSPKKEEVASKFK